VRLRYSSAACPICGSTSTDGDWRVLVHGRVRQSYCSQACVRVGVRTAQVAQRKVRRRRYALLLSFVLAAAGVGYVRHLRLLRSPSIAASKPPAVAPEAPPEPTRFGPRWPPSDDDWGEQFAQAAWVYPLPGPARRRPTGCRELLSGSAVRDVRAHCRSAGHCGVDLGGELWGEHVYAAHDGVIDRLQRSEDASGGVSVHIAHWGGAVVSHYFHLAAIPTRLAVGMHVEAGDVIGLVGDSGVATGRAHLHFALSVRPSSELPDVYWDPEPLMTQWPVHSPERGSVAGLLSANAPPERIAGTPSPQRRAPPLAAKKGAKTRSDGDVPPT